MADVHAVAGWTPRAALGTAIARTGTRNRWSTAGAESGAGLASKPAVEGAEKRDFESDYDSVFERLIPHRARNGPGICPAVHASLEAG